MLYGVLHKGDQRKGRNQEIIQAGVDVHTTLGRIGITESLKLHIVPDAAKLLRKRDSLHTVSKNKTQIS